MNNKHNGLVLAGIIITYIMSAFFSCLMYFLMINADHDPFYEFVFFLVSLAALFLAILYHKNLIENYILVGIFALFVSLIGGIFILVGQPRQVTRALQLNNSNGMTPLEYKLRQLDTLLKKGIITKEEYDSKRKSIIDKY